MILSSLPSPISFHIIGFLNETFPHFAQFLSEISFYCHEKLREFLKNSFCSLGRKIRIFCHITRECFISHKMPFNSKYKLCNNIMAGTYSLMFSLTQFIESNNNSWILNSERFEFSSNWISLNVRRS